ncbi:MAG: isoprenylcysteine carboxylmethyltransferase family protein [Fimbriimonadaceae bacterium]|nr:isoprenylcysteine carboxylmethyltransferase family protein [Alphaproteobacteria bacterium]
MQMVRFAGVGFALAGFAAVHLVFAYLVFWLSGFFFDKTINSPVNMQASAAIAIDLFLIGLFGLQHTFMARNSFKTMTARFVAPGLERAVYVWCAVAALYLLVHFYQPVAITIWKVETLYLQILIQIAFVAGWTIAAIAYLSAGVFYLLGVSQALAWFRHEPTPPQPLVEGYAYKMVRNPQQLGLLIAFWATPHMTVGHLVFAAGMSVYIFIGMAFEERSLTALHGEAYLSYKARVPAILPRILR